MEIINEIEQKDNGAHFYKADLHVHTPASECYAQRKYGCPNDKNITAEDIVNKAIEKGLTIIAITDHNSEGMYVQVAEAAKGKPLLVLPGVEITTPQGRRNIHLIALFDPVDYKKVDTLLTKIEISHEHRGKSSSRARKTILEILEIIDELKGIAILPHVDCERGLDVEIEGESPEKMDILKSKYLHGIEVKNMETLDSTRFKGLASIQGSDAHCLEHIGSYVTLMKMGKPSFEGLRQALGDYESRILLTEGPREKYPRIIGLKCMDGFLDNQTIYFNNQLNCLIGGKGTGKSSVIELIRYALDVLSNDPSTKDNSLEMIENVLGNGKISMVVETGDEQKYLIETTLDEKPHIYREDGTLLDIPIEKFHDIFNIETYSQGELLKIAKSSEEQLEMIDKYIDLDKLKGDEEEISSKLYENGKQISKELRKIETFRSRLVELDIIKEQLRILEKRGVKKILEQQILWRREEQIFKSLTKSLNDVLNEVNQRIELLKSEYLEIPKIDQLNKLPNRRIIEKSLNEVKQAKRKVITNMSKEVEILNFHLENVKNNYDAWNIKYNEQKEKLRQIFIDFEEKGIEISEYRQYLALEAKRTELEELKRKVKDKNKIVHRLKEDSENLITNLKKLRKNIFNRRKKETKKINGILRGFVKINIQHEGNTKRFEEYLVDDVLSSSRNRIYKEDRKKIATAYRPIELAKILDGRDIDTIVSKISISEETADKLFELTKDKIYEIQTAKLEDKISIELNDRGWKPVSKCSDGQRCTTILSIVMSERNIPLIIDQPEDSLDNTFIYTNVVKVIRKIKNVRQLLIATHNANIPVLGDGELMLVMASNGTNGFVTERGVIDDDKIKTHAQAILEGGKEAFQKRRLKYGF